MQWLQPTARPVPDLDNASSMLSCLLIVHCGAAQYEAARIPLEDNTVSRTRLSATILHLLLWCISQLCSHICYVGLIYIVHVCSGASL